MTPSLATQIVADLRTAEQLISDATVYLGRAAANAEQLGSFSLMRLIRDGLLMGLQRALTSKDGGAMHNLLLRARELVELTNARP